MAPSPTFNKAQPINKSREMAAATLVFFKRVCEVRSHGYEEF